MSKNALGKGLSALIPDKVDLSTEEGKPAGVTFMKTEAVRDNALQPRSNYAEEKLAELVASIKEKGILQPIIVRDVDGEYEVVAGERRLRAARAAGLAEIPVIVKNVSNQEALVLALVENIQREELNAIEEAESFSRLIEEFGFSQEEVAKAVGKDRSSVSNTMRLLKLPAEIQGAVVSAAITMGHARALLAIEETEGQLALFRQIMQKGLSVRETEQLVRRETPADSRRKKSKSPSRSHELVALEEELQQSLGTRVHVLPQKKRGKIVIEYYSPDDLDRILQIIRK